MPRISPHAAGTCQGTPRKVIIVGAGISGAGAAQRITSSNPCFQVTVVEARDRVGGRMFSRNESVPGLGLLRAEMGGQWIHGITGNPISALAQKYKLTVRVDQGEETHFAADGRRYNPDQFEAAEESYDALKTKAVKNGQKSDSDISMDAAFRKTNRSLYLTPYMQNRAAIDFDFDYGALDNLSAYYFDDDGFDGPDALVIDGYDNIPKGLMKEAQAAGATLVLNFKVTEIQQLAGGYGVTVIGQSTAPGQEGKQQSFTADAVIVTLPLGVLKAGDVAFKPPLSTSKAAAMGRLGVGPGVKVALFYKKAFWDLSTNGYSIEDSQVPENRCRFPFFRNLMKPEGQTAILSYAVGQYAARNVGNEKLFEKDAKDKVAIMFPAAKKPENAAQVTWVKDWTADPYSKGIYSYPRVGTRGNAETTLDYDEMGKPEGKVLFAGEHTYAAYRDTVHGAYLSGVREADRLLKMF